MIATRFHLIGGDCAISRTCDDAIPSTTFEISVQDSDALKWKGHCVAFATEVKVVTLAFRAKDGVTIPSIATMVQDEPEGQSYLHSTVERRTLFEKPSSALHQSGRPRVSLGLGKIQ